MASTKWTSIYARIEGSIKCSSEAYLMDKFSATWSRYGVFLPSLITNITAFLEVAEKTLSVSISVASTSARHLDVGIKGKPSLMI